MPRGRATGAARSCARAPAWAAAWSWCSRAACGPTSPSRRRSPQPRPTSSCGGAARDTGSSGDGAAWPPVRLSPRPAWYDRSTTQRQARHPHRHAAGHLSRHLPGQGLRVLDGEAVKVELPVLLGRTEPGRGRRRRREVDRRGDGGGARRAPRVRHHLRGLQHRPPRGRDLPRHPRAVHPPHQAGDGPAGRRADAAPPRPAPLRRAARDGRQPRLVLLRDLRPAGSSARSAPASTGSTGCRPIPGGDPLLRGPGPPRAAARAVGGERRDHRGPRAARRPRSRPSTGSRPSAPFPPSACSGPWPAPTTSTCRRRGTEAMVPVFRRLYEACMERGLPSAARPTST